MSLDFFESHLSNRLKPDLPKRFVLGVSGGADSMALAWLIHQYCKKHNAQCHAVTIDHKLRKESTQEAEQVHVWLKEWGMTHQTLPWQGEKPKTGIQAAARDARYTLLSQYCQEVGAPYLLTAHHLQDQAETFLIRLAKGSGLKGLTGIRPITSTPYGFLLRPLLSVHPNTLKELLNELGQPYLEDPSNEKRDFTRVRVRQLLPLLASEGLTIDSLQETVDRLNHSQRLIDEYITFKSELHGKQMPYGHIILDKSILSESSDLMEEILRYYLEKRAPATYPIRRERIQTAVKYLQNERDCTLHGCRLIHKKNQIWIVREWQKQSAAEVIAQGTYLWDHFYRVIVSSQQVPASIIPWGALVKKNNLYAEVPFVIRQTLPVLKTQKGIEPIL